MSASNAGPRFNGWRRNATGGLTINVGGTVVATAAAGSLAVTGAASTTTTFTAGTGLTVTTGNTVNSAGDERITVGNVRLGVVSAFATTEPTSAVVFKAGTAAVGAITTSSGLFASSTVLRKIIADGTASNVET